MRYTIISALAATLLLASCTQEQQNKLGRDIQNWTGTNGVMEVYSGDKVVRRWLKVDKLSTALGTDDGKPRAYRFGYGVLDENLNFTVDADGEEGVFRSQRLQPLRVLREPAIRLPGRLSCRTRSGIHVSPSPQLKKRHHHLVRMPRPSPHEHPLIDPPQRR